MRGTLVMLSLVLAAALSAAPAAALPPVHADFDADGFTDLAVGVPFEDLPGGSNQGAVQVFYGANGGLTATDDQFWTQTTAGGSSEPDDQFGSAVAAGDFDGDGFADLAVGARGEDVGSINSAGAVTVLYGTASGLSAAGAQTWHQNVANVEGTAEPGDSLGSSAAAGDFDGDGFADLAIGAPFEDLGSVGAAGAINVLYGSAAGVTVTGDQVFHQDSAGIADVAEPSDLFAVALAAGDFSGDGRDDLAIGVFEDLGAVPDAGAVHVLYGASPDGLGAAGSQLWHQNSSGVEGVAENGDFLGLSLAAGDFDENGLADLAAGAPGEDVGTINSAGSVNVLYGAGSGGLSAAGNQSWTQDSSGLLDTAEANDAFGSSLAAADFDGSGVDDLAIGARTEDIGTTNSAGAVSVLYGAAKLSTAGNQFWHQDASDAAGNVNDAAEAGDQFGDSVAGGDFDGDGASDLAVGAGHEAAEPGPIVTSGALNVLYGSDGFLTTANNQFWRQGVGGVEDAAEPNDQFGVVAAAGGPTGGTAAE